MNYNTLQKLSAIINTLNTVTVCGKNNLNALVGSITVLEEVLNELQENHYDGSESYHS